MKYPDYYSPDSIKEAINYLEHNANAKIIAGGTDLVPKMRAHLLSPSALVDLKKLSLNQINTKENKLSIGACTTHQIINSALINHRFPMLVEACRLVGSPPIRN